MPDGKGRLTAQELRDSQRTLGVAEDARAKKERDEKEAAEASFLANAKKAFAATVGDSWHKAATGAATGRRDVEFAVLARVAGFEHVQEVLKDVEADAKSSGYEFSLVNRLQTSTVPASTLSLGKAEPNASEVYDGPKKGWFPGDASIAHFNGSGTLGWLVVRWSAAR